MQNLTGGFTPGGRLSTRWQAFHQVAGFPPGGRLLARAAAATDSAYHALAIKILTFLSKFLISSISSLTLG